MIRNNIKKLPLSVTETYGTFIAIRLHFISDYDYFKYGPKKVIFSSFVTRKDRYSFIKLNRLFNNETELANFVAINFYNNPKIWVHDLFYKSSKERYTEWVDHQENREKYLLQDLKKLKDYKSLIKFSEHEYPILFNMIQNKEINIDTFLLIDFFTNIGIEWDNKFKNDIVWNQFYQPYLKYRPFFLNYKIFDSSKYKQIIFNMLEL